MKRWSLVCLDSPHQAWQRTSYKPQGCCDMNSKNMLTSQGHLNVGQEYIRYWRRGCWDLSKDSDVFFYAPSARCFWIICALPYGTATSWKNHSEHNEHPTQKHAFVPTWVRRFTLRSPSYSCAILREGRGDLWERESVGEAWLGATKHGHSRASYISKVPSLNPPME